MGPLTNIRLSLFISLFTFIFTTLLLFLFKDQFYSLSVRHILLVSVICAFTTFIASLILSHLFVFKEINTLTTKINNQRNKSAITVEHDGSLEDLSGVIESWSDERKTELEQVKKLEAYRKEFLGNVSHELKTPMFNIQGYISTLLDGGLEDEKINRDYLQRADKSVDRMISIIDDLEAISQLETGELGLEMERFDLVPLIHDLFLSQELRATSKAILLTLAHPSDKPVYVVADRFRIRQVLSNLIVNSIKYGKEYGETTIKFIELEDTILLDIIDNGIGIASQHLPRLFERFYRVDKGRSREQGGTGLGLAIVKHIMEAHGQHVTVNSVGGAGTTFSLTLKKG